MKALKRKQAFGFFALITIFIAVSACASEAEGQQQAVTVNSGPLRFEERLIIDSKGYIYGIGATDLDADGDLDLTSADATTDELLWHENDGRGNLTKRSITKNVDGYLERHATGDINGDGHPDVVIVNNLLGHLLWFENSGTPRDGKPWQQHVITTSFMRAYDVAIVDLDNDGDLDVAASAFRGDCFAWFENPGPAGLSKSWKQHVFDKNIANTRMILTTDVNRDGKVDLLGTATYDNLTVWYENTGEPAEKLFRRRVIDDKAVHPAHGQPVDLDGDGDVDVLMASGLRVDAKETNSHQVAWYENIGSPGVGGQWKKHVLGKVLYGFEAVSGDLDGDGDLDVIATGGNGGIVGKGEISWFENPGDPKGPWKKHFLKNYPSASQVIVMDLDKDGLLDIAACSAEAGTFHWWRNLGLSSTKAETEPPPPNKDALHIGSRLELFVGDFLVGSMKGATRKLHSPQPVDVALKFDSPWDGSCSMYISMFADGDKFRMYYRGLPMPKPVTKMSHKDFWNYIIKNAVGRAVTCYAESSDGIHWQKPNLGLHEAKQTGTKDNNILLVRDEKHPNVTDNFTVFKDTNPNCRPEARYKAVGRFFIIGDDGRPRGSNTGNIAFQSPDGIHWTQMQEQPIHVDLGHTHDAQSIAFWDTLRKHYVEYHRKFRDVIRDVRTSTSTDFINWTEQEFLDYGDVPAEHFNHFSVIQYARAPHVYLGFGERLVQSRDDFENHPASGISDAVFLSSRDGMKFDRSFMEAWIRPGLDVKSWCHCGVSLAWGLLQTGPEELSVYWVKNYYQPDRISYLQRGTLRLDGFVSVNAPYAGGEFTTKPLTFEGRELIINFSTSAVGSVRVEILDAKGAPIKGFALADCKDIYGDRIKHVVVWKNGSDVSKLAGKPLRLRFVMKDADLYSIRFQP